MISYNMKHQAMTILTVGIVLFYFCYCSHQAVAGSITYILPNNKLGIRCPSDNHENCYILNDLLNSQDHPFTNDSIVQFLPGIHIINSTKPKVVIRSEDWFTLMGDQEETSSLICVNRFSFDFIGVTNVQIANISFQNCSLPRRIKIDRQTIRRARSTFFFYNVRYITLMNVTVVSGEIVLWRNGKLKGINTQSIITMSNMILKRAAISYESFTATCTDSETIHLLNSKLHRAFIQAKSPKSNCVQFDIQKLLVEETKPPNFQPVLLINAAKRIGLMDIIVHNNDADMFHLNADMIELKGLCLFQGNAGGGYFVSDKSIIFHSNSRVEFFDNNLINDRNLLYWNMISFLSQVHIFNSVLHFENNRLISRNGALMVIEGLQNMEIINSKLTFINNTCYLLNSPIVQHIRGLKFYTFMSILTFKNNTAEDGGILNFDDVDLVMVSQSELVFENNRCYHNKADITTIGTMLLSHSGSIIENSSFTFTNNSATLSGGLTFVRTKIVINGSFHALFVNNEGESGGAMAFYDESYIDVYAENASIKLCHNKARSKGGGIFIEDTDYINSFTRILKRSFLSINYPFELQVHFEQNTAAKAGNEIYGGWIDNIPGINQYFNFTDTDLHSITSNPTRVCMCVDLVPVCNITEHTVTIISGQTFQIEAIAVGQRFGIVPSIVFSKLNDSQGRLGEGQSVQNLGTTCTPILYTVFSAKQLTHIELTVQDLGVPLFEDIQFSQLYARLSLTVELKKCPLPFRLDTTLYKCVCPLSVVSHDGISCDMSNFGINKLDRYWVSLTFEHIPVSVNTDVIIHDHCPLDYCLTTENNSFSFSLESPDDQCAFRRSGVLCGSCARNFSQVFGTSRCRKCSNIYILALFPSIILAGLMLVVFLLLLNLTVSVGTINGLVFYANIIRASQTVYFPPDFSTSFFSVFIAWLNLDLGIETCFYNGLDAYARTWLQFVFPLYIWLIVIIIIVISRLSTVASRIVSNNAVQVLATLFLFSYTKILRAVITAFSYTVLTYPDGFKKRVWLYDGNVDFLKGKHIPLFIASLLLLILVSIPFTLSLVSIQWLQRISHYRPLFWAHKFMPLFDAYTGPYKHKHRYWTGVLLIIRVVVLIVFSVNQTNNPAINLLTVAIVVLIILVYFAYMRVYKNWLHSLLEIISFLNLGIFTVATFYQLVNNGCQIAIAYISTSIAFALFAMIVFYHLFKRIHQLKNKKKNKEKVYYYVKDLTQPLILEGDDA